MPIRQWHLQPSLLKQLSLDVTAARGPRRVAFLAAKHFRQVPAPFDGSDRRFVLRNGLTRVGHRHNETWRKLVVRQGMMKDGPERLEVCNKITHIVGRHAVEEVGWHPELVHQTPPDGVVEDLRRITRVQNSSYSELQCLLA